MTIFKYATTDTSPMTLVQMSVYDYSRKGSAIAPMSSICSVQTPSKKCPKCGVVKDRKEFWKRTYGKDGVYSVCKECEKERYLLKRNVISKRHKKYHFDNREKCFILLSGGTPHCERCGSTDMNSLTVNHIYSPKDERYDGLRRSGEPLYRQILAHPELKTLFSLLCMNCNVIDSLEKREYYTSEPKSRDGKYRRRRKAEICSLWNNKCFICGKTFPTELLTINHRNGREGIEKKKNTPECLFRSPKAQFISRIDSGELELACPNCNSNYSEASKWVRKTIQESKIGGQL